MFSVNGVMLITPEIEILQELRRQLLLNDRDLLREFKTSGHNIMTTCPFHKDGQERKPSFGVSTRDGACHCFTCGWAGSLEMMVSNVFGYNDDGAFGRQWLSKNFLTVSIENRKPIEIRLSRGAAKQIKPVTVVTEEELDSYRYIHPYMYQRGLTDELIEEFDIGFDGNTQCITFPVLDINKNPLFIARRSVKYKFFNYPEGAEKPVYAAHKFVDGSYSEAIICESILNTLTCWKYGRPSMALIGTGTDSQYEILKKLPVRKYILATDPDKAGRRAAQRFIKALGKSKLITQLVIPEGEDINSLDSRFLDLVEVF